MKSMTNVDIYTISDELNDILSGARVDKSFQPRKNIVVIRFHIPGHGRADLVMEAGVRLHLSQYPLENPKNPPTFPMLLRKRIKGAHVKYVKQHNFDRVVEIVVKKDKYYTLIVELFDKGNIILLDDKNSIILPLKRKQLSSRDISSKKEYVFPKKRGINPIDVSKEEFIELIKNSDRDIIRTLASNGLGSLYAEEIIFRAEKVDKNTKCEDLKEEEIDLIYESLINTFKPLKEHAFKAQIVKGKKEDVLPLDLLAYENSEKKYFKSFNEACDEFYSSKVNTNIQEIQERAWNKKVKKFEKRLELQEETLKGFEKTIEKSQEKGEIIYSNYPKIEETLNIILDAREKNYSWKEIGKIIKNAKKEGMNEAKIIESISPLGELVFNVDNIRINIDTSKTIYENAEDYYEKAKKSKRKIKGALIAIENTKKQIEDIKSKKELAMEHIALPKKRVKKNLKWFEKLRWFLTSDGVLVISGRDANTNETVVKKHLEKNDIYLHADIHGASSVVAKLGDRSLNDNILKESAIFAASFSTAWSKAYSSQDVFWVHPEQVSKTAESGEFIPKGSFIIRGNRNYIRGARLQVAIGIVDYEGERIMIGPVDALEKYSENFVVIKPGFTKKESIAKKILHKINKDNLLSLDDVIRVLPSGKCDIDEEYHQRKRFN